MRRRVVGISMAAVLSAGGVSAYAAAPQQAASTGAVLVLQGSRSASATITLRVPTAATDPFRLDVKAAGSYAGYLISDLHGRPLMGSIMVRGVGAEPGEAVPLAAGGSHLRPGRYRVTLITDGRASVAIPIAGSRSQVVQPRQPARVFARVIHDDVLPSNPAGSPVDYDSVAVPAGHHQLAALTVFYTGTAAQAGIDDECFTTQSLCELGDDSGGTSDYVFPGNTGDTGGFSGMSESPTDFASGTHAVADGADAAIGAKHAAFVLVIG